MTTPLTHTISAKETFGFEEDFSIACFPPSNDTNIPEKDDSYVFDKETTESVLAGFIHGSRVLIQGYHGTGKSTHIEQIASRLNWPCVRVNLDAHVSRLDLLGKDTISLKDGKQVTEFKDGILPWALQNPVALVFDEYDAGRPDVMFVIQRILEAEGKLTLLDQNRVLVPHPQFRLFGTANTIGLGDASGLYQGTQQLNQGQLDRWDIVTQLNYLPENIEVEIIIKKFPEWKTSEGKSEVTAMVKLATLTRQGFVNGDVSTLMSPRTIINWVKNCNIFNDRERAFQLSFLNRCDELERPVFAEYYQRAFGIQLSI